MSNLSIFYQQISPWNQKIVTKLQIAMFSYFKSFWPPKMVIALKWSNFWAFAEITEKVYIVIFYFHGKFEHIL